MVIMGMMNNKNEKDRKMTYETSCQFLIAVKNMLSFFTADEGKSKDELWSLLLIAVT